MRTFYKVLIFYFLEDREMFVFVGDRGKYFLGNNKKITFLKNMEVYNKKSTLNVNVYTHNFLGYF